MGKKYIVIGGILLSLFLNLFTPLCVYSAEDNFEEEAVEEEWPEFESETCSEVEIEIKSDDSEAVVEDILSDDDYKQTETEKTEREKSIIEEKEQIEDIRESREIGEVTITFNNEKRVSYTTVNVGGTRDVEVFVDGEEVESVKWKSDDTDVLTITGKNVSEALLVAEGI